MNQETRNRLERREGTPRKKAVQRPAEDVEPPTSVTNNTTWSNDLQRPDFSTKVNISRWYKEPPPPPRNTKKNTAKVTPRPPTPVGSLQLYPEANKRNNLALKRQLFPNFNLQGNKSRKVNGNVTQRKWYQNMLKAAKNKEAAAALPAEPVTPRPAEAVVETVAALPAEPVTPRPAEAVVETVAANNASRQTAECGCPTCCSARTREQELLANPTAAPAPPPPTRKNLANANINKRDADAFALLQTLPVPGTKVMINDCSEEGPIEALEPNTGNPFSLTPLRGWVGEVVDPPADKSKIRRTELINTSMGVVYVKWVENGPANARRRIHSDEIFAYQYEPSVSYWEVIPTGVVAATKDLRWENDKRKAVKTGRIHLFEMLEQGCKMREAAIRLLRELKEIKAGELERVEAYKQRMIAKMRELKEGAERTQRVLEQKQRNAYRDSTLGIVIEGLKKVVSSVGQGLVFLGVGAASLVVVPAVGAYEYGLKPAAKAVERGAVAVGEALHPTTVLAYNAIESVATVIRSNLMPLITSVGNAVERLRKRIPSLPSFPKFSLPPFPKLPKLTLPNFTLPTFSFPSLSLQMRRRLGYARISAATTRRAAITLRAATTRRELYGQRTIPWWDR